MTAQILISSIVSPVLVGIFLAIFARVQAKRNQKVDKRAEARKEESLLALDMQMATAKLSYAVAMAYKRGYPNGEVEEGIEAYKLAKEKYFDFINRQATEQLR